MLRVLEGKAPLDSDLRLAEWGTVTTKSQDQVLEFVRQQFPHYQWNSEQKVGFLVCDIVGRRVSSLNNMEWM